MLDFLKHFLWQCIHKVFQFLHDYNLIWVLPDIPVLMTMTLVTTTVASQRCICFCHVIAMCKTHKLLDSVNERVRQQHMLSGLSGWLLFTMFSFWCCDWSVSCHFLVAVKRGQGGVGMLWHSWIETDRWRCQNALKVSSIVSGTFSDLLWLDCMLHFLHPWSMMPFFFFFFFLRLRSVMRFFFLLFLMHKMMQTGQCQCNRSRGHNMLQEKLLALTLFFLLHAHMFQTTKYWHSFSLSVFHSPWIFDKILDFVPITPVALFPFHVCS